MTLEESEETVVVEEETITPDGLLLKELPTHLRYVFFFGEYSNKPVIISVASNDEMEKELVHVLKRNIGAFTWCIDDIKGISPSVCMTRPDPDTPPGFPGWSRLVKSHCTNHRECTMEPHLIKK